jgi:hypothetical protein
MDEQGPNSGLDQPPDRVHAEPGEPTWCVPQAPPNNPIYRGHQLHGPTPPIHLLGFRAADTDRVPLLLDSTTDHRPHPHIANIERSRTSVITDPLTWVTGSVCRAPQILRGADLSATFVPRSTRHRLSVVRLHTPP